eukprot:1159826-Pelagomonas_calceolata.AAC.1
MCPASQGWKVDEQKLTCMCMLPIPVRLLASCTGLSWCMAHSDTARSAPSAAEGAPALSGPWRAGEA